MGSSGGKRVQSKLKLMAKLGENLYKTTKVFRMLEAKPRLKWQRFARNNAQQQTLWKEWWDSPQSDRWKKLPGDGDSWAERQAKASADAAEGEKP